jgi:hypothetical protein
MSREKKTWKEGDLEFTMVTEKVKKTIPQDCAVDGLVGSPSDGSYPLCITDLLRTIKPEVDFIADELSRKLFGPWTDDTPQPETFIEAIKQYILPLFEEGHVDLSDRRHFFIEERHLLHDYLSNVSIYDSAHFKRAISVCIRRAISAIASA